MENNQRMDKVKAGLDQDLYEKIDQLDALEDQTITATTKLADILDGYRTHVDSLEIPSESEELEIVEEKEIEVEITPQNDRVLKEYNEQIHEFGIDTLTELLSKREEPTVRVEEEAANTAEISEILDEIVDYKSQAEPELKIEVESDVKTEEEVNRQEFTQTIIPPEAQEIEMESTIFEEKHQIDEEEKEPKGSAILNNILLIVLIIVIILVFLNIFKLFS